MTKYITYGENSSFTFSTDNKFELELFYMDEYLFCKIVKIEKYVDDLKVSEWSKTI